MWIVAESPWGFGVVDGAGQCYHIGAQRFIAQAAADELNEYPAESFDLATLALRARMRAMMRQKGL